jgi:hypothetical protein
LTAAAAVITYVLAVVCYIQYRKKTLVTLAVWGTAFLIYALISTGELVWGSLPTYILGLGAGLTLGLLLSGSMLIYSDRKELHVISAIVALTIFLSMTYSVSSLIAVGFFTPILLMFVIFAIGYSKTRNKLIALMILGLVLLTVAGELHQASPAGYRFVDACGYSVMLLALSGILK